MQILISDANIFIDLETAHLTEKLFELPYVFKTPDLLFETELREQHEHLLSYGLQLGVIEHEAVSYVEKISVLYAQRSINDCFALALARQEQCFLLTGDMKLRRMAEQEGVIVRGTIWVFEQLIIHQKVTKSQALAALDLMAIHGRRLPYERAKEVIADLQI